MLSPERRALLLLLSLAVAGQAVRHLATRPDDPPGQVEILSTLQPGSPAAQRDSSMRLARPLAPGEKVDADLAEAEELARLPRVGPGLAKVIVADRDAHGAFGSLEQLDRVAGIGPGLLQAVKPHVTFSGVPRPSTNDQGAGVGTAFAPPSPRGVPDPSSDRQKTALNVNRATAVELDGLPGIGPSLAQRIVADREARGPFASVGDLDRVPGIGPALVARLGGLVSAP